MDTALMFFVPQLSNVSNCAPDGRIDRISQFLRSKVLHLLQSSVARHTEYEWLSAGGLVGPSAVIAFCLGKLFRAVLKWGQKRKKGQCQMWANYRRGATRTSVCLTLLILLISIIIILLVFLLFLAAWRHP